MSEADALPTFRYFRDPFAAETLERRRGSCPVCREERSIFYVANRYTVMEAVPDFCVECLASGRAADRFSATFQDLHLEPDQVQPSTLDEIMRRTPAVPCIQGEMWPICCGDACVYVGEVDEEVAQAWTRDEVWGRLPRRTVELLTIEHTMFVLGEYEGPGGIPALIDFECRTCLAHHTLLQFD